MPKTLTESDLTQFTGTERWYRHPLMRDVLFTDGAKYVAEAGGAWWLLDAIASWQLDPKVKAEEFQHWVLKVADERASLICDDGNGREVCRQEIEYTDFPLAEIRLYVANNTIHLPSEY